jgi:hypothetical protein
MLTIRGIHPTKKPRIAQIGKRRDGVMATPTLRNGKDGNLVESGLGVLGLTQENWVISPKWASSVECVPSSANPSQNCP